MNDRPSPTTPPTGEPAVVFQPSREELLEELAMSGRVLRVAASALIRVDAHSARRRQKRLMTHEPKGRAPKARGARAVPAPAEPPPKKPAKAARAPIPAKPRKPAQPAKAEKAPAPPKPAAVTKAKPAPVTSARILKARSTHHAKIVAAKPDAARAAADEELWETWANSDNGDEDRDPLAELNSDGKRPKRPPSAMRGRARSALDSWAEREVSLAMRLERALGSKRTPPVG